MEPAVVEDRTPAADGCFGIYGVAWSAHPARLPFRTLVDMDGESSFEALSDTALVIAISRLQQEALAELYRRHGGPLLSLASRVLREAEAAEELVENTFLSLWHDPEMFDPERSSLRSFLMAQAHIRAVDIIRSSPTVRAEREAAAKGEHLPADEALDLPVGQEVRAALRGLSPAEEKVIALAYFGAHTYREIAVLLDETESTVKSCINEGLTQISTSLQALGGGHR